MPTPTSDAEQRTNELDRWVGRVHSGDCLDLMPQMPAGSVDMVLADLPYGTTRNRWDSVIDLDALWDCYRHVTTPEAAIVLTAAQPFTSVLVCSNLDEFRYEWIWSKTVGSGQLNARRQPLRTHESVLVFYRRQPTYNAQLTEGTPYRATRTATNWEGRGYNGQRDHEVVNNGTRVPKSVLHVPNPRIRGGHPTQKPLDLFTYLINTYTNPGDVVLDNVLGSGTTAEAALRTGRAWIGMENDPTYLTMARDRIAATHADLTGHTPPTGEIGA